MEPLRNTIMLPVSEDKSAAKDLSIKRSTPITSLPKMIDISEKPIVKREAVAEGRIKLKKSTIALIRKRGIEKGDPVQIATIGGIQAAKITSRALMMCHPIPIESVSIEFEEHEDYLTARANVVASSKTGVEMEALNAVTNALLNVWDVVKKYEKDLAGQYPETKITDIKVVRKRKGGVY